MEKLVPEKYRSKIIKVTIPGVSAYAWPRDLLLDFISDEKNIEFAILGGDVISVNDTQMCYTYDNWSTDSRYLGESFNDYCKRCSKVAKEYLEKYPLKSNILFVPVMTSEITAGMSA